MWAMVIGIVTPGRDQLSGVAQVPVLKIVTG